MALKPPACCDAHYEAQGNCRHYAMTVGHTSAPNLGLGEPASFRPDKARLLPSAISATGNGCSGTASMVRAGGYRFNFLITAYL
jgi:hypothetical protein